MFVSLFVFVVVVVATVLLLLFLFVCLFFVLWFLFLFLFVCCCFLLLLLLFFVVVFGQDWHCGPVADWAPTVAADPLCVERFLRIPALSTHATFGSANTIMIAHPGKQQDCS